MDFSNRLALSYYKKLADLNAEHHVYLVQHRESGKFFVEKELTVYDLPIYQQLQELGLSGTPKILELHEENGVLTVIEDYISGTTLQEKMDQGELNGASAVRYFLELCTIVAGLHNVTPPIIHRDIKPSNIMITPTDNIVLLDFNAAKFFSEGKEEDTVLLGTKGYAAPEQYGFGVSTVQTDIYALGKVLEEVVASVMKSGGPGFSTIVKKATQLNPADRYQTALELKKAVASVAAAGANTNENVSAGADAGNAEPNAAQVQSSTKNQEHTQRPFTTKPPKEVYARLRNGASMSFVPPGFRTRTPWKIIVAILGYAFIFYLSLTLEVKDTFGAKLWVERIFYLAMMLATVFIATNYRGAQNLFPLARHPNRYMHYLGVYLFAILVVTALFFVMVLVQAIF